ncbi:MAG: hypothetical protein LBJ38_01850 [Oscillospiraceae bacterium]|jgi:hypothetical protein|nr:hypothetical protein [Oscillospiraceae bacterium]
MLVGKGKVLSLVMSFVMAITFCTTGWEASAVGTYVEDEEEATETSECGCKCCCSRTVAGNGGGKQVVTAAVAFVAGAALVSLLGAFFAAIRHDRLCAHSEEDNDHWQSGEKLPIEAQETVEDLLDL